MKSVDTKGGGTDPMNDVEHVREIERTLSGASTSRDDVVKDSWRRCVQDYGLDPTRRAAAHIITETQLREHRDQSERLIATARSGLHALFRQIAGQNYVLLLSDASGICVDFFGDPQFEDELRKSGLFLGSDWTESLAGTSGVGSCIYTGQAVTVHQGDHFGMDHTRLSCTAAPIYDSFGQLVAVLDISLLRSPSPKTSQNLAMNLVTASARRIELANLMAYSRREWVLRLAAHPEFLDVDPDAAVSLDGAGRIIGLTRAAETMLMGSNGTPLLGRSIQSVLDIVIDDLPDLMRDKPTEDRVIRLRDGSALFAHAIAPQAPRANLPAKVPDRQHPVAFASLAGSDPAMTQVLLLAARMAETDIPLLILGETGTGKSRLARAIHTVGGGERRLITLDCATFDEALVDQSLRALNGAPATLLLRGLEALSPAVQPQLIALLDQHPSLRPISMARVDVTGLLDPALYYRLVATVLTLPPVRLRHDFDWLLDRLLRKRTATTPRLTLAARAELASRPWPGNIREMERTLDVALATASSNTLDLSDIPATSALRQVNDEISGLEAMLDACHWNMALTARRLGVNRSTVLRRVRKAGLQAPE
ncbi:sigma-54-dependent Fis family transcriptional regulator [Yoonia sp.]|uniref:sigma-54-dependent Fis family transcriptional regulator n=1 Tax=Yoonia sp. TaxID=2212373 RepID=UPI00390C9F9B